MTEGMKRESKGCSGTGAPSPEELASVLDALEGAYGNEANPPEEWRHSEPLDGLILTVLSQNTNDRNREVAYAALRRALPTWEEAAAHPARMEGLIRPAGLAPTKSARIVEILRRIRADFGAYSLEALRDRDSREVRAYLSALPGVGPKTVACVLMFDLDMPAFPVDTHIARIARRLGWAGTTESPGAIQERLESVVPPRRDLGGHVNMIFHGRAICHARKPECPRCVLMSLCPSARADGGSTGPRSFSS